MKNIIYAAILCLILCSCGSNNVESIIESIYGEKVNYDLNDYNDKTYLLDYKDKRDKIEDDSRKIQDKIDKMTNSLSEVEYKDSPGYSDGNTGASAKADCLSSSVKWETPSIRIIMITNRCVPDVGNYIYIIVTEK